MEQSLIVMDDIVLEKNRNNWNNVSYSYKKIKMYFGLFVSIVFWCASYE